jgi:hypothetical protein
LVASASPRFKDFRVDFEKISNSASKAARDGREGLSPEDGMAMFGDMDWDLRIPLQKRYVDHGAHEAVAHYHAKRFKLLLGRNEPWPDEPASDVLRLFAEAGRADVGVALIRTYVDMQHKRLKSDYSTRNPRKSRVERSEGVERAIAATGSAIATAIPDRKAELLKVMESIEPYLTEHGADEDRAWLDAVRRELWMEKRA